MSADNGIYILRTISGNNPKRRHYEYRVEHLQAIENYMWDDDTNAQTEDQNVWIVNARKMWSNCIVHSSINRAMTVAKTMKDLVMKSECPILEYGISTITIQKKF